jgi:regulator of protease activity HflC (stomatin/prohibitin superfamily)
MESLQSKEKTIQHPISGYPMILVSLLMFGLCGYQFYRAGTASHGNLGWALWALLPLAVGILILVGFTVVEPNMSRVLLLFGSYRGTVRRAGFFCVNPFTVRRSVSLRVHNFNSDTLKVNDLLGNPIEIGAVIVWRVQDTALAAFDVENFEDYVRVQTESAIRQMATVHPYDDKEGMETSLRGSSDVVNSELKQELTERLSLAGINVLEARLSHLAYAPEIAGAMLRRQQAEAIIAARTRIVEGAVGMVEMALDRLKDRNVLALDEERKASMVSNLLVVLCSEQGTHPVVNTGTLYH